MGTASQLQVLLVDDEPQILIALEDLLADQFKVLTASSAEAALLLMEKAPDVAVVVTDQRMPNMPGDEFVARLSDAYDCQRIMVTGYADLTSVVRAVNEGRIFAYVTKPWNEADLRQKVTKAAEQFRLSQELASEKKLLDDLMNHSPDGVYFKNAELRFVRANHVAASWLGQGVEQLVAKRLSELSPAVELAAEIEQEEQRSLLGDSATLDAVRQLNIRGKTRWISERKAPILSPTGDIAGLVGISRDITEQKELELQLLQSQKMEAIGRLAGGVAHDFNNLLVIIQGYADLVHDRLEENSPGRADIQQLLHATDRATALTQQLLTFSRKTPVTAVSIDLNQLVINLEKMLSRLVDTSVHIKMHLGEPSAKVRGDITQFEQIVLNLVINARDAMPNGGELSISTCEVQRSFEEKAEANYLCLSVRDTGIGMSVELQARIFEPFFSTKEVGKGTGLGLSTVYGIVHQWGGYIRIDSEEGSGSCIHVYLPVATESDEAPASSLEPSKNHSS